MVPAVYGPPRPAALLGRPGRCHHRLPQPGVARRGDPSAAGPGVVPVPLQSDMAAGAQLSLHPSFVVPYFQKTTTTTTHQRLYSDCYEIETYNLAVFRLL